MVISFSFLSLSRFLLLSLIVVPSRYFQCQPKYGLFAPVHKVTKIGFPSTTPAKAKAAAVRRVMATTPASMKRSPSASSLSSMSSVASSVSSKPSRTGLVHKELIIKGSYSLPSVVSLLVILLFNMDLPCRAFKRSKKTKKTNAYCFLLVKI